MFLMLIKSLKNVIFTSGGFSLISRYLSSGVIFLYGKGNVERIDLNLFNSPYFSLIGNLGNHSHSHEYLIDWEDDKIKYDLETSIKIFKQELGYSPKIFSYPFGEYSSNLKKNCSRFKF